MAFNEKLRDAIDAKGGRTQENLSRISRLAREIQPDISVAYLSRLLLGHPPRPEDFQALAGALGISPTELMEGPEGKVAENRRKAIQIASERMKRPDLADEFVEYVEQSARFRNQTLTYDDLYAMFNQFLLLSYEVEGEELT